MLTQTLIFNDNPALSRFTEDVMKRTKRLSIELKHREVSITVEGSTRHVRDSGPAADNTTVCPTCGSRWISIVAVAEGDVPASVDLIHHALEQSGLHMEVTPIGHIRICQRSFEELKEKF